MSISSGNHAAVSCASSAHTGDNHGSALACSLLVTCWQWIDMSKLCLGSLSVEGPICDLAPY